MNIGIVGAEGAKFTQDGEIRARQIIYNLLSDPLTQPVLVSGRCHLGGIDIWAEEIANTLGHEKIIFPPKELNWKNGFEPRNRQIAKTSDIVHCIAVDVLPKEYKGMRFTTCYHCHNAPPHVKSGGCWTMHRCKQSQLHIVNNY